MPMRPNTTCDIYRTGNAPPAAPDVAGVPCYFTSCFDLGRERGEKEAQTFRFTAMIYVATTSDIRDNFSAWTQGNRDTVYIPDKNGVGYNVNFVERVMIGQAGDQKIAYLDRLAVTWPWPAPMAPIAPVFGNGYNYEGPGAYWIYPPQNVTGLLIVFVLTVGTGSLITPAGWTLLTTATAADHQLAIICLNTSTPISSVAFTFTGTVTATYWGALQFSSAPSTTGALDSANTTNGTNSGTNSVSTPSLTPIASGTLVVAAFSTLTSGGYTGGLGSGWTLGYVASPFVNFGYRWVFPPTATQATETITASGTWTGAIAAIK